MGVETTIQWCDSSKNLQMGCQGCELWNPKKGIKRCYAGTLTARFGGRKGWPERFELPKIFPERLQSILKMPNLKGQIREQKPWLNYLPRTIFLNAQGDTFTEGLPIDWLTPYVEPLATSEHIYIILTKRAHRMAEFFNGIGVPKNFWLCTSITNQASLARIPKLLSIKDAPLLGLSIEPLWEDLAGSLAAIPGIERIGWAKLGGESGNKAEICDFQWIRNAANVLRKANPNCAIFVKQAGTKAYDRGVRLHLNDWEGGDWTEWPEDVKFREMPWDALAAA